MKRNLLRHRATVRWLWDGHHKANHKAQGRTAPPAWGYHAQQRKLDRGKKGRRASGCERASAHRGEGKGCRALAKQRSQGTALTPLRHGCKMHKHELLEDPSQWGSHKPPARPCQFMAPKGGASLLLGPILGLSWAILGSPWALPGLLGATLGPSWLILGHPWGSPAALLRRLGTSWANFRPPRANFVPLGGLLIPLETFPGPFGAYFWAVLGPSWTLLGPSCAILGPSSSRPAPADVL